MRLPLQHTIRYVWLFALCVISLCSCNIKYRYEDALLTLSVADSLRSEGKLMDDSLRLYRAHNTLCKFYRRHLHPYEYAYINYLYGRLLDLRGNKTEAMQCFINATHTTSHTPIYNRVGYCWYKPTSEHYNLLGRVFCNIGTLCHEAKEYQTSYDMFSLSARMFKNACNENAYYYALNDMAFEAACMKNKEQTITLTKEILQETTDSFALALALESLAELYKNVGQYDSAIYFADKLSAYNYKETTALIVKSQSFSMLGIQDSAVYYAVKALEYETSLQEKINLYYILQHDDNSIETDSINQLASKRADMLRVIDKNNDSLSQALLLLQKDSGSQPNYKMGIFVLIIILIFIGIAIYLMIKKSKHHKLFTQKVNLLDKERQSYIQQKQLLIQQSEYYDKYKDDIENHIENNRIAMLHSTDLNSELCWTDYDSMCDIVNKTFNMFASRLQVAYCLNEREVRLCVLILLDDFKGKYLSGMLNYGETGIRNLKSRTAQKIGTNGRNLHNFLIKFAIGIDSIKL